MEKMMGKEFQKLLTDWKKTGAVKHWDLDGTHYPSSVYYYFELADGTKRDIEVRGEEYGAIPNPSFYGF